MGTIMFESAFVQDVTIERVTQQDKNGEEYEVIRLTIFSDKGKTRYLISGIDGGSSISDTNENEMDIIETKLTQFKNDILSPDNNSFDISIDSIKDYIYITRLNGNKTKYSGCKIETP